MKNKGFFLFIILIFFNSCKKTESDETTLSTKDHSWEIQKKGLKPIIIKWNQYQNDTIKIKTPIDWRVMNSKEAWLLFSYAKENPKLYFSIMKYNIDEINLNSDKYMVEIFNQISAKTDNFRYILKKLNFSNGTHCYMLTIFTKEKNQDYITYDLIYQPKKIIYDFAFKTLNNEKNNEINYRKFLLIVESFEFKNEKIIDDSKFIINQEKRMKFEDLN